MNRIAVTFVSIAFLAPGASAQSRNAVLTLPSGKHQLIGLAKMAAQIRSQPLHCDAPNFRRRPISP
ncbi:MAG: hypothetical protein ACI89X_001906 [Planctomycetota bacterium]|jgi:hypothetical protein